MMLTWIIFLSLVIIIMGVAIFLQEEKIKDFSTDIEKMEHEINSLRKSNDVLRRDNNNLASALIDHHWKNRQR